nr:MAG TPA: hypothetical protein [Caudoviricetes sp.]
MPATRQIINARGQTGENPSKGGTRPRRDGKIAALKSGVMTSLNARFSSKISPLRTTPR